MHTARTILLRFLPFWLFLAVFKFGGGLHYTLMSPYGELFFPVWLVGLLIGGASLLQLAFDVPSGYLLDRFGYVRMLKFSTIAFFFAGLCIALGLTQTGMILSLLLAVLGWQFYGPGGSAYILSNATERESGRYFSLRDTFASLGIVFSSVSLPFVLLFAPSVAGVILCVLFGISMLLLFLVPDEKMHVSLPSPTHHIRRRSAWRILADVKRLNPASGMLALHTFSGAVFYGVIWFVVPLVIAAQQSEAELMGFGLAVFDFSVVVLGYLLGTLADRIDKRPLVFFGLLAFAIFSALVGWNFGWLFILFGFLATTGDETAEISLWSWMHHLDREHTADGTVAAVITFFEDLGWAVGPALAGALYAVVGPSLAISFGAIPIFIVWLIYFIFVHHRVPREMLRTVAHRPMRRRRHKM